MRKINNENFNEAMEPLMNRMEERHWTAGKAESYACAGIALAIVLVLTQIKLEDSWRIASFACAAMAIPMWVGFAYVNSVREMYSLSHQAHPSFTKYIALMSFVAGMGGLLLFASFCCLLASFHTRVAGVFVGVSALIAIVLIKQEIELQRVLRMPPQ